MDFFTNMGVTQNTVTADISAERWELSQSPTCFSYVIKLGGEHNCSIFQAQQNLPTQSHSSFFLITQNTNQPANLSYSQNKQWFNTLSSSIGVLVKFGKVI